MANSLTPGGHKPTGYRIKKNLIPDDAPIKLCSNNYTEAVLAENFVDLADILIEQNSNNNYIALDRYATENRINYFATNYMTSPNTSLLVPWEHTIVLPYNGGSSTSSYPYRFILNGSRPTFKTLITFCGQAEKMISKDVEIFKYNTANSIQISRSSYGFSFSFTNLSGSSQTINAYNNGQSVIPTCLFVQLQAEGGKGGTAQATAGGCGGGAGDCQFAVLDWAAALKYIKNNQSSSFGNINNISFKIKTSPNTGAGFNLKLYISYKLPNWTTTNDFLLLTVQGGENGPAKKWNGVGGARGGKYELSADSLVTTGKVITVLDIKVTNTPTNYGYGGIPSYGENIGTTYDGYDSITGYCCNTIRPNDSYPEGYKLSIDEHSGGKCGTTYGHFGDGGGGGGASIIAGGGDGGRGGVPEQGKNGRCGSGGGGASGVSYGAVGTPGNGGCAWVAFYTDNNFGATVPTVSDILLAITHNSSYDAASSTTKLGYLQEAGNYNNIVYIYPNTTTLNYPTGCNESNTLFYYNQSGYMLPIEMSKVDLNKTYTSCDSSQANPQWGYDIKFISK